MAGLSTGINIGYAQVLNPMDTSGIFKMATDMQKTADALKNKKAEQAKEDAEDFTKQAIKGLPNKVYDKHQDEIDRRKEEYIAEVKKAVDAGNISPQKQIDLELQKNRLVTDAMMSADYAKQIAQLQKSVDRDKLSPSSQEYLDILFAGYNPDRTMNYSIDPNKFIERPDYTKLVDYNLKPVKTQVGTATEQATNIPGVNKSIQKWEMKLTPEQIETEKDNLWNATAGQKQAIIINDVKENIERGNPQYEDFKQYVTTDQNGNPDYALAAEQFFKSLIKVDPVSKEWTSSKYITTPGYGKASGAGMYETYDPEYVTTDVSDVVRPSEDFYNALTEKNPNLTGIKKGNFKYVNYSLSGAVSDPFAESKDEQGNVLKKLILDEVSGKYYDFAGNDVTKKVEKLSDSRDIETEDWTTSAVQVDSYLPNIQKSTVIKVDPAGVQLSGKVTKDGVSSDKVVAFTTDEMEIVDDKRGPYLKAFEVDAKQKRTGKIVKIPYTKKIDEIIAGKINFVSKGKDTWETPDFVKFDGAKKQSSTQKSVPSGQKQGEKKVAKIDTKGLSGAALVKARKQNKANGLLS